MTEAPPLWPDQDKLEAVFAIQESFRSRAPGAGFVRFKDGAPVEEDRGFLSKWTKEFGLCILMEASELIDWIPWKVWSKRAGNKAPVTLWSAEHAQEVRTELIDIFAFLVNLMILWGMKPEDVVRLTHEKVSINHERQNRGGY
jgi:hypothetical protein